MRLFIVVTSVSYRSSSSAAERLGQASACAPQRLPVSCKFFYAFFEWTLRRPHPTVYRHGLPANRTQAVGQSRPHGLSAVHRTATIAQRTETPLGASEATQSTDPGRVSNQYCEARAAPAN